MDVTVAVIPRERFRPLSASLRSLFSTIPANVRVIVIDGGADEKTRQEVRSLQEVRHFELVESDKFLLPNMARNVALDMAKTKYIAFCDNDLTYYPDWLNALIANAEQHDAVAVAPATLIGPTNPPIIHHAGGKLTLGRDNSGQLKLRKHHRLDNVRLPDAERTEYHDIALEHDYFEYHCVLVAAEAMRVVGGHDERLMMHEHLDSSLRLKAIGGKITFESKAHVMYTALVPFVDRDWPYFLYRWSSSKAEISNQVFAGNWGIHEESKFSEFHRNRAMTTALPRLPRVLNRYRIKQALLRLYRPMIVSLDLKLPDDPEVRMVDKPAPGSLLTAGIKEVKKACID